MRDSPRIEHWFSRMALRLVLPLIERELLVIRDGPDDERHDGDCGFELAYRLKSSAERRLPCRMNVSDTEAWLEAHGFVYDRERERWCIAWSCRSGYDFTSLEFYYAGKTWFASVGHHASGTNPRMHIGECSSLAEVRVVFRTIRRINGYPTPGH